MKAISKNRLSTICINLQSVVLNGCIQFVFELKHAFFLMHFNLQLQCSLIKLIPFTYVNT